MYTAGYSFRNQVPRFLDKRGGTAKLSPAMVQSCMFEVRWSIGQSAVRFEELKRQSQQPRSPAVPGLLLPAPGLVEFDPNAMRQCRMWILRIGRIWR